ncbi:hypothetical protein [Flagellimonas flava]|uniref:Uncharacterized protein n=1 Tax=Flagellimonas flava TaxID=570519 RepID=A0A1M5HIY9_9FLAO|nr:hypothetical protein [Allomuricauda flava]SHG15939.1 hypothetical protein SAMN04488116_0007 [Allomuricauda flava]
MKNTKKVTHLLMPILLMALIACQQQPKKEDHEEKPDQEHREKVKPPKQIISLEESKNLYDNYTRNRVEIIQQFEAERSPEEAFDPARFAAFDYAGIKQYIAFIEQEAKEAGVDISSLRLYFANYPDKEKFPDGKKLVHPRQNSIFIVPTIDVDGQDFGFFIGEDGKAKLIKDAVGPNGIGVNHSTSNQAHASFVPSLSAPVLQGGQSLNYNRGQSGPPPSPDF